LAVIDAASFLVCLDDASPVTAKERALHYHVGDGYNRWNDKSLQFPVCSNGISGIIGDHSMMDASTVVKLNSFVNKAILSHISQDPTARQAAATARSYEEYSLTLDAAIENEIQRIHHDYIENTATIEHEFFAMDDIGEKFMRSIRCPPKSAFQILAMMASYEHFGSIEPCWETVSLGNFLKGRVAIAQGVLPPVAEFLRSYKNRTISLEQKRKYFIEAAKAHANLITREGRGRGHDRYLTALQQVIQPEDGHVAFFDDYAYTRTRPRKFMSHTHETGMLELGFQLRDPDAIWEHYVVEEDWYVNSFMQQGFTDIGISVRWSICGHIGQTLKFRQLLEKSLVTLKEILGHV
jgi:hypothetical protein